MSEYYFINAMKLRVDDPTAVCAAANAELATLRERHPDDVALQRFKGRRPDDAGTALRWLSSPLRLQYLFAGVDVEVETTTFARADHAAGLLDQDPLEAFRTELDWQREPSRPPSNTPTMRQVSVTEEPDIESYTVGLAEHPAGAGQSLLFMCRLDPETREPIDTEPYCLCTETQATHYGGVRECVLDDNILRIGLTADATRDLGIGPELNIILDVSHGSIDLLREGLGRVLTCGPDRPRKLAL
jgi:hypothetical protein